MHDEPYFGTAGENDEEAALTGTVTETLLLQTWDLVVLHVSKMSSKIKNIKNHTCSAHFLSGAVGFGQYTYVYGSLFL